MVQWLLKMRGVYSFFTWNTKIYAKFIMSSFRDDKSSESPRCCPLAQCNLSVLHPKEITKNSHVRNKKLLEKRAILEEKRTLRLRKRSLKKSSAIAKCKERAEINAMKRELKAVKLKSLSPKDVREERLKLKTRMQIRRQELKKARFAEKAKARAIQDKIDSIRIRR